MPAASAAHLERRTARRKAWLVRCYHGLGDSIQFVRFLQPLRQIAHSVVLWVQPDLVALARTAGGADEVLALHDGTPEVDYDIDVEIMELPHALRISAIPPNVPYLFVPRAAPPFARDGHVNVGLVWAAGDWDEGRSLPLDEVKRIVGVPGIRLFSLQRGPRSAEASSIPILDCGSDEVIETATRMLALDLIVSVDTMAAHLAGALARPVWTLLQRIAIGAGRAIAGIVSGIRRCVSFIRNSRATGGRLSNIYAQRCKGGRNSAAPMLMELKSPAQGTNVCTFAFGAGRHSLRHGCTRHSRSPESKDGSFRIPPLGGSYRHCRRGKLRILLGPGAAHYRRAPPTSRCLG